MATDASYRIERDDDAAIETPSAAALVKGKPVWHPPIEVVAGDTWTISGTLTDTDGSPLDLADAGLEWVLIDDQGACVASFPGLAEVVVMENVCAIIITLASDVVTDDFLPGRCTDALRVTFASGARDTMWRGAVLVDARPPWAPAPPPPIFSGVDLIIGSPVIDAPSLLSPGQDHLG
jgi:hypothetical protein